MYVLFFGQLYYCLIFTYLKVLHYSIKLQILKMSEEAIKKKKIAMF